MLFLLSSFQIQSQNCPSGPFYLRVKVWVALENGVPPQNQQEWNTLQNQISNLLQNTQDAYNDNNGQNGNGTNHNIYFNYVVEYIVAPELEFNVDGFFSGCLADTYDDPNRLDVILLQNNTIAGDYAGAPGYTESVGGEKLYSVTDGTLIHEMGHMLNLEHTHGDIYECEDDIPPNWVPGQPYSSAATGDFVADTPIHPVVNNSQNGGGDFDDVWVYSGCNINWGATSDNCTPSSNFPTNYSSKMVNGIITYDNVLERNFMANVFPPNCNIPFNQLDFTDGQAERMRCHIDQDKQAYLDNNKMPDQFIDFSSGCIPISGIIDYDVVYDEPCYMITSDLIIAGGNVSFLGTNVEVSNQVQNNVITESHIYVNEGSSLSIQNSNFKGNADCSTWGGIISPGGANMIEIGYTHIEDCNAIDLNRVLKLNVNNSLFKEVMKVNLHNNNVGFTDMNNNAFIGTNITLTNQFMHFQGCKFSNCQLVVDNTDGSNIVFERSDEFLCYFNQSFVQVNDAGEFVVDDSYFDKDCTNPIIVIKCDYGLICRSYFDNCNNQSSIISSGGQNIYLGSVDKFYIFHNYFENDGDTNIFSNSESNSTSLIQNNIFNGSVDVDINSSANRNVDISCNFHEGAGYAWLTNNMITQGNELHPAGNIFDGNGYGIVNQGTSFNYYYNEFNPKEFPTLLTPNSVNREGLLISGGQCLPRTKIAQIWDISGLCFPSYWTNWPECQDIICEECVLPPPVPVSSDAEGRVIIDNDEILEASSNHQMENSLQMRSTSQKINKISPNPFSEVINLSFGLNSDNNIYLLSTDGKKINVITINQDSQLDLSFLQDGIYMLIIEDNNGSIIMNEKIIKI